jgi:hypothetical protein
MCEYFLNLKSQEKTVQKLKNGKEYHNSLRLTVYSTQRCYWSKGIHRSRSKQGQEAQAGA